MSVQAIQLTEQDNNKNLAITVGDIFTVRLDENPTTGYVWSVEGMADVLILQNTDYVTNSISKGEIMTGVGGKKTFAFIANAVGTVTLRFKEWRAWEGDSSIVNKFAVKIQVK